MAVILNTLGEIGVSRFGVLIGFIIPIINVLAVSTLIWYSGQRIDLRQRIRITTRALISNPLILACLAGLVDQAVEAIVNESFAPALQGACMLAKPFGDLIRPVSLGDQQDA
mgnify:CR=1 FL=1